MRPSEQPRQKEQHHHGTSPGQSHPPSPRHRNHGNPVLMEGTLVNITTEAPDKDTAVLLVRDFIRAGYHEWPAAEGYHYLAIQLSGQLHATVQEYHLEEAIDHYKAYLEAADITPGAIAEFYEQDWNRGLIHLYHADITRNLTEAFNALLPNRYGIITDAQTQDLFNETTTTELKAAA